MTDENGNEMTGWRVAWTWISAIVGVPLVLFFSYWSFMWVTDFIF